MNLTKGKEVAADVWLVIMSVVGSHLLDHYSPLATLASLPLFMVMYLLYLSVGLIYHLCLYLMLCR